MQDWLWRVNRIDPITPSTAHASSASGKTMDGLLPPSSSETGATRSEAACMTSLPTAVDPVKLTLRTSG